MKNNLYKNKYKTQTIRLQTWNYEWNGNYFVTICTKDKCCNFGKVADFDHVELSELGEIAKKFWMDIPRHYDFVTVDECIVMPNHIHGILGFYVDEKSYLKYSANVVEARQWRASTERRFGGLQKNSLSSVINQYKGAVKKWCNKNGFRNFQWQSGFYEHIIRSESSLEKIRKYIADNPAKWHLDEYYC